MKQDIQMEELERVLRLERMMTRVYDIAMHKVQDPKIHEILKPFRMRHNESAQVLEDILAQSDAPQPQLDRAFKSYIEEVMSAISESVRREEALGELRIAEAALKMSYGQALGLTEDSAWARVLKDCMNEEAENVRVLAMAHEQIVT